MSSFRLPFCVVQLFTTRRTTLPPAGQQPDHFQKKNFPPPNHQSPITFHLSPLTSHLSHPCHLRAHPTTNRTSSRPITTKISLYTYTSAIITLKSNQSGSLLP